MAQTKKNTAAKTAKKCTTKKNNCKKCQANQCNKKSNTFFVITMSMLAATLLFADLLLMNA